MSLPQTDKKPVEMKSVWCFLYQQQVVLPDGKCDSWCDFDCDARVS